MSWMAVAVRLWVRFRVVREPGWDDAFIFMAAVRKMEDIARHTRLNADYFCLDV